MSILSALKQKRESRQLATATPAISATQQQEETGTVARKATVAVANPEEAKAASTSTSRAWLLHFADRHRLEVHCNPDTTRAWILERYPDALAAEPTPERITPAEAEDIPWPLIATADDRRTCGQCANLAGRRCLAAWRGEIAANRDNEPARDIPRRCEGYAPDADDPDTRQGRERWPGLIQKEGE